MEPSNTNLENLLTIIVDRAHMISRTSTKACMALFIAGLFMLSALVIIPIDTDADSTFEITDQKGNTVTFDGPVDHIITIGKGVTATTIQLGQVDKIVVADKYSNTDTSTLFDALRAKVEAGTATAGGTIYSSGSDLLKKEIVDAADTGKFDKEKDVILLTGADTYLVKGGLIDYFKDLGFRVLAWNDVYEYNDIIDLVGKISMIVTGEVASDVDDMKAVGEKVKTKLGDEGISEALKTKAFYVTYSGNTFKVGNNGSIATSMIQAAGGNVITVDASKSSSTYEANLTEIIEKYGTEVVIFADNTIASNEDYLAQLRTAVGDKVKIIALNPLWNNYSIESMEGVKTMAGAMYPDYFPEWDTSGSKDSGNNNVAVYICAAVGAVILILCAAVYFMRRN